MSLPGDEEAASVLRDAWWFAERWRYGEPIIDEDRFDPDFASISTDGQHANHDRIVHEQQIAVLKFLYRGSTLYYGEPE